MIRKKLLILFSLVIFSILLPGYRYISIPPAGNIAYVRDSKEIRLINADGTNDKQFWTHPDAKSALGIYDLAWRPDGKELVFSSGHASASSLYHSDLYIIKSDGTGLRKLTNPPGRNEFARYPKGSVTVTVRNNQFSFQQTQASSGIFTVYVAGADMPQQITVPPGKSKTITFKSVADFGKKAQAIVATWGNFRWFIPGTDVQAGRTVKAPDLGISGNGIEYFGAFHPVWRSDGTELSYRTGVCTINRLPANPPVGEFYHQSMFGSKNPLGTCFWDWGPTSELANQIIYTENSGEESSIYRMKEGGVHPGTKLTSYSNIQYQILQDLHWLPDGSGLLYSTPNLFKDASNIFRYDFKTKKTTNLTNLENEFARTFTISPDGNWLVYERAKELDDNKPADLWIQNMDKTESRLLVKNGRNPAWGR